MTQRKFKNKTEQDFATLAHANGWRSTKRGWPDFLCFNAAGDMIAVEVKPRIDDGSRMVALKSDQAACMDALVRCGVRCFVSDGKTLEKYDRAKHRSNRRRSVHKLSTDCG